jgi:tRNA-dihydrouridine synthase B
MQISIGNLTLHNNVLLAPMAGITNLPFRILVREFGCALAFTEMISANGLVRRTGKSYRFLNSSLKDKPLGVQIFGSDPVVLSEAAQVVSDYGADLLDINMGCPVKKVVKTGAGAALLKNPVQVSLILHAVRKVTSLPLTVKVRSGWNRGEMKALEIARIAEDSGVNAVIVHPRTADQGFSGAADWNIIEVIKENLSIPVIGSGDIRGPDDAYNMLASTGCDAVMIGRGSLGNPWIFKNIILFLGGQKGFLPPLPSERERIIKYHMEMEVNYLGESLGVRNFRKHLLWYTKGMRGGNLFREAVGKIHDKEAVLSELERFFIQSWNMPNEQ